MTGLLATLTGPAFASSSSIEVRDFGSQIDAYARYEGQSRCASAEQPGVRDFRALLQRNYGANAGGILRSCSQGGKSEHKEGRAYDWMLNAHNASDRRKADEVIGWLLATDEHGNRHAMARRFGIMYIIWNRQVWNAYRPNDGWRPYTGASPHTDHVHFSFTWDGAQRKTSYWTAPDAAVVRPAVAPGPFRDVSSQHSFVDEITWASEAGITTGFQDGSFRPGQDVTRAQMVTFLWRTMDSPRVTTAHGFRDVPSDAHYEAALRWAAAEGVIGGTAPGLFDPTGTLSRAQMARMMHRLVGEPLGAPMHPFIDVKSRDDVPVSFLHRRNITGGIDGTRFAPHHTVTRQQAATFLYRLASNQYAWTVADRTPSTVRFS